MADGQSGEAPSSPATDRDGAWRDLFGFETPYRIQADAIETTIDVASDNGYVGMEGPCGTGKTMAALTAGATLVRHTHNYDRVLVVTPVKQQRLQFVEDLRTMNATLAATETAPAPLDGIALVGKRDLCPYGREGVFPAGESTHDRCEDLREHTADLVEADRRSDDDPRADAALGGDPEDIWWDPELASDLVREARLDAETHRTLGDALATAGAESPYPRSQPRAPEGMAAGDDTPLYCPFEADWFARNKGSPVDFSAGEHRVVTAEEYLPAATARGTCPHRVMGTMLEHAEVIIGNYNHVFDPGARPLIEAVLDSRTFLVVDEAHRLEERVRDLLSDRVGRATLKRARNDCSALLSWARQGADHRSQVEEILATEDVPLRAVERAQAFYDDVLAWLDERVATHLDGEWSDWRVRPDEALPSRDLEVPLRDPADPAPDDLTAWAEREGYDGDLWRALPAVGTAVEDAIDSVGLARSPVCAGVGVVMARWWDRDHARYLREIELEHSPKTGQAADAVDAAYQRVYTPGLVLFDCMPAESLRDIFDGLGGGVLMSATLSPLDVFTEVSGLAALRATDDEAADADMADSQAAAPGDAAASDDRGDTAEGGSRTGSVGRSSGRPVRTRSYPLRFPADNRASWIVDATPFTARNRGDPTEMDPQGGAWNETRDEYAQILRAVSRSPGNVLVAMPNYREAAWAGAYLRETVAVPVLIDESSSNEATETLKREFFDSDGAVLVTSTRGTLTEGVDYDGDKLATALVVGVPLVNVGSPRVQAVRRAYADAFGESNAFEYALTVPAVRRARQAIGRVIRGADECGVRIFADSRYTPTARNSVHEYLAPAEREEFVTMTAPFLEAQLEQFWADRRP